MSKIWSIILAAGESKRMGQAKMLLNINGKTMIEQVINNVTCSDTDNTLVVLGAYQDLLVNLVKKSGVKYCINENYKDGMLSSIQCGFNKLPPDYEAALIFQGDQPLIPPPVINIIIAAYKSSDKGIVIPIHDRKRGHPILIDKKYGAEIAKLDTSKGLRSLSYKFSDDVLEVETNDPGILRDFDTINDYQKEFNQKL
jgi:molybdenum cofactor cytidylyltransferase